MTDTDYDKIVRDAYIKFCELKKQRDNINAELDRLQQFIFATANMLPDEQQKELAEDMALVYEMDRERDASLIEAIRRILSESLNRYFTVRQMRDALKASNFDFSQYTANPMASISTTLKRLKPDEVRVTRIEGVTAYRGKKSLVERAKARAAFYGEPLTGKLSDMK